MLSNLSISLDLVKLCSLTVLDKHLVILTPYISFLPKKPIKISVIQCKTSLSLCGQRKIKKIVVT